MGNDNQYICVLPLSANATTSLGSFDAGRAQCSLTEDKHSILAVIETGMLYPAPYSPHSLCALLL
jgi:hypothetical protein